MNIQELYNGLERISRENQICIFKVKENFDIERHNLYMEAFKISLNPNLDKQDMAAYIKIKKKYNKKK